MKQSCYLITGCGRSGTSYFASALEAAGVHCGHEEVFHTWGNNGRAFRYESSWYGAPFIKEAAGLSHVLHVVRDPIKVMASFYRIGLCSPTIWRQVTYGKPFDFWSRRLLKPAAAMKRIKFVRDHRRFLDAHSTVLHPSGEIERLEAYWVQWNGMVEDAAKARGMKYLRIRLEDIEEQANSIAKFLDLDKPLPVLEPTNTKAKYAARPMPEHVLSKEARELAQRYGYNV